MSVQTGQYAMFSGVGCGVVRRAYRYRFYPTLEQERQLACTFGCVRYVCNRALAEGRTTGSATYFRHCFTVRGGTARLAKQDRPLGIVWSRPLPDGANLVRAIADASWAELRRRLEYKTDWYGGTVIAIDRVYPSSNTCSACGAIHEHLPLGVRKWTCGRGATHERDVNAAKNIVAAGLAVSACGDGVRPPRS